jgi:SAM-dependent methyltransferase
MVMREFLDSLSAEAKVLDLGCGNGTFDSADTEATVIRLDLDATRPPANFIRGDAAHLPFAKDSFDAIVSNNSLEHITDLDGCLKEIGRVLRSSGRLYVAVPDASTVTDRLYRWLASGGGHVNPFVSAEALAAKIEKATSLRHRATRTLCSSLSFLNRKNQPGRMPRKLRLLGGGSAASLQIATYVIRMSDQWFRTRLSVYGWVFYFGSVDEFIDPEARTNVCIGCGAGHSSAWLLGERRVLRRMGFEYYRCPNCETPNLFTRDENFSQFRETS